MARETQHNKKSPNLILFLICVLLIITAASLSAEQIQADVTMILERLTLEKQERLAYLADEIETYLNDYDWTGETLDNPIPVTMQIFLNDNSVSYEERYSATFIISNNSDTQYHDKYWKFPYKTGTPLSHNENAYNPFTGFIDFYIYLLIGSEYDRYGQFLGEPYFEKAKLLSEQGMFDATFVKGWEERCDLIKYIMSDEYKPFRKAKDLYYLGLSYVGEEDSTARRLCGEAVDLLDEMLERDPEEKATLQFIQANHLDMIKLLKSDPARIEKLIIMDPDRAEMYRTILDQ